MFHLSQASMFSKSQYLSDCHCLQHQSLGSQTSFRLALLWKLPLWLHGPSHCLGKLMWKQPLPWQWGLPFLLHEDKINWTVPSPLPPWSKVKRVAERTEDWKVFVIGVYDVKSPKNQFYYLLYGGKQSYITFKLSLCRKCQETSSTEANECNN